MRIRPWAARMTGVLLIALTIGYGWHHASGQDAEEPPITCPQQPFILLDPGHGGIDGGANRDGLLEKEIVLDITLRTAQILRERQISVLLTREADVDLGGRNDSGRLRRDLNHRIRMANQCRADLVVSVHVNSAQDPSERGMMLFYQPSPWGRDAAYLFDQVLRQRSVNSRAERPHPRGDFALLRRSRAPAILAELGFVTHPADRKRLADPVYREQVAQALAEACGIIWHQWVKGGNE